MSNEQLVLSRVSLLLIDSEDKVIANISTNSDKNEVLIDLFSVLAQKIIDALVEDVNDLLTQ